MEKETGEKNFIYHIYRTSSVGPLDSTGRPENRKENNNAGICKSAQKREVGR